MYSSDELYRLGLLFCQFDMKDPICSVVMWHRLRVAKEMNLGGLLNVDVNKVGGARQGGVLCTHLFR